MFHAHADYSIKWFFDLSNRYGTPLMEEIFSRKCYVVQSSGRWKIEGNRAKRVGWTRMIESTPKLIASATGPLRTFSRAGHSLDQVSNWQSCVRKHNIWMLTTTNNKLNESKVWQVVPTCWHVSWIRNGPKLGHWIRLTMNKTFWISCSKNKMAIVWVYFYMATFFR